MTIHENENVYFYLMVLSGTAMVIGFMGFLLSLGYGSFWMHVSITVLVLACLAFVVSAVPVSHNEALAQALTKLPEQEQALFRDTYHQQDELVVIEVHEEMMRAVLPLRTTLYVVAAVYAGTVVIKPTAWAVIVSTAVLGVLLTWLLSEIRASLRRHFRMAVQRWS